ncbi:hypothetical protein SCB49_11929 [unidentified eubacterium SCB49]|nr:hypothetical protein SCB49_11929 [unidentified eubacterium SCB49]
MAKKDFILSCWEQAENPTQNIEVGKPSKQILTMRKHVLFSTLVLILLTASCKPTLYTGNYGQVNETQIVLSNANFNVLGSFTGTAIAKKNVTTIKNKEGLIALAKKDLLANAKNAGVELKGSRTLMNITTDVIQNEKHVKVVVCAEIIEFTK